jgi:hypothetical protein
MRRPNTGFAVLVVFAALLAGFSLPARPGTAQVPGQNVNMVSGTQWPYGDPFKQRQNEPSLAVSTRNPLHLLAGANDYRSVDIPFADPDNGGEQNGDAWLGVFKSFDGGQTWQSTLLPGYPQDTSPAGMASPLRGWSTAADPIVRAANNGIFYYGGIAFNRGTNNGIAFVARFIDLANKENGAIAQGTDPIRYLGAIVLERGNSGQFLDKPWIAVDIPRGTGTCTLAVPAPGGGTVNQTIPAGRLYAAYSVFLGSGNNPHSKIYLKSSSDCGATWTKGTKLNDDTHVNQGSTIAIDPRNGTVYVAWRTFGKKNERDTIQISRIQTGGNEEKDNEVEDPVTIQSLPRFDSTNPAGPAFFDQGMTGTSIRTNSLPTIAVDGNGRVYVAWSQRGVGPGGDARVVLKSSADGKNWSGPFLAVDSGAVYDDTVPGGNWTLPAGHPPSAFSRGHQVMPAMTFAGGKLMLVYYDLRFDHTTGVFIPNEPFHDANGKFYFELRGKKGELLDFGDTRVFSTYIDDYGLTERRHTIDVRIAQADPAATPAFSATWATQYRFGTRGDESGVGTPQLVQLQVNPPNLPMFVKGTAPFLGDYIDVAGLTMRPDGPNGAWRFTTAPEKTPVHYAVWTSNQDVRPPADGNWANYTPPASTGGVSLFDPTKSRPTCQSGNEGTRDQNIYVSRITQGLLVVAPQSSKPLSTTLQRAFVITVQNATKQARTFRLKIASPPIGGFASFTPAQNPQTPGTAVPSPVPLTTQIDVTVGGNAGAARNVYATSSISTQSITVDVVEFDQPGAAGTPVPNGLTSSITLNADGTVPTLVDPDGTLAGSSSSIQTVEIYTPNVSNPNVSNPNVSNPNVSNPNVSNPNVSNPNVSNPNVSNPNVSNPDIATPNVSNPNVSNPNVSNPNVSNPNVSNPNVSNAPVSDATYSITNSGNTASTYTVKLIKTGNVDPSANLQLLVNKTYAVPVSTNCVLFEQTQTTLLANVPNPVFVDIADLSNSTATDPSLTNPTFALGPGETALVTLRGAVPVGTMTDIVTKVAPVSVPHAPNTNSPTNTPTFAAPLFVTTASLPDGVVGKPYPAISLAAIGGKPGYNWTAVGLPAGLSISGNILSGTPSGPSGTATPQFTVTDTTPKSASASLTLRIVDLLIITTASLPSGTSGIGYSQPLAATGGLGTRTWTVVGGTLPAGIGLSASGVLSGIPVATGTSSFTVQLTDSASPAQTATKALSIAILSASVNASVSVSGAPSGLVGGEAFSLTVHVEDDMGAIIPGALITLSFGTKGCPAAVLSGTTSATTNADGNALFSGLSIDRGGPGFTINASASAPGFGTVVATTSPIFVEGFCATGPTAPPRTYASLTKLIDGRVLLAGGQTVGGVPLDTARVYDPSTGAFTPTAGNMLVPRFGHQAVLLPSGKVLIVGGSTATGPTASTELFEPSTGTFSVSGSMSVPRIGFRATWVPAAGKVLLTGGQNTGGFLNSAEVYDPAAGTSSPTGFMTTVREFHTATPIPDGRVLVAGGAGGAPGTAELWDPATGGFSAVAPMAITRDSHEALALSDGRVFLVGGETTVGGSALASAEIFDPATGLFTLTGSMGTSRSSPLVAPLPTGKVLVAGGYDPAEKTSAEVYDPAAGTFSPTGSLVTTQGAGGAVLLSSGRVLVAGSDQFNPNGELFFPLELVAFPPVTWGGATITNVKLNGGTNVLTLPGGGSFTLSHDYTIVNPVSCPTCIDQIEVGPAIGVPACSTGNLIPTTPQSGTGSATLTVPSVPGVYYLGVDVAEDYSCFGVNSGVPFWWSGPPTPNRYIGKVIVP